MCIYLGLVLLPRVPAGQFFHMQSRKFLEGSQSQLLQPTLRPRGAGTELSPGAGCLRVGGRGPAASLGPCPVQYILHTEPERSTTSHPDQTSTFVEQVKALPRRRIIPVLSLSPPQLLHTSTLLTAHFLLHKCPSFLLPRGL